MKMEPRNKDLRRYWKDKVDQIKMYIKAHKYNIKIPEQLQFEDSESENDESKKQTRRFSIAKGSRRTQSRIDVKVKEKSIDLEKVELDVHVSPEYGRDFVVRPNTATAMTRLSRATSISAHRHNWKHRSIDSCLDQS